MKNNKGKKFNIGDKIVHYGEVYAIFEIKEQVIFFSPYFKDGKGRSVIRSIPAKNIEKTDIRMAITKKELKKLLKKLSEKQDMEMPVDINKAKEKLRLNNSEITAQVLKRLWQEQRETKENFTKSKSDVLTLALKQLSEEVAFVGGFSLSEAGKKIKTLLRKSGGRGIAS